MRDPDRIRPLLAELEQFWLAHPDWRLGQIVSNCTPLRFAKDGGPRDPFMLEDDEFLTELRKLRL